MMDTSKLVPNDPRITWKSTKSRGHNYSFQVVEPPSSIWKSPKDTIILVHGFPDLSFGWRNQAPYLASLGYRVVIPDMLGYGRTDAPADPCEYTLKKLSDDVAAVAAATAGEGNKIILGGHDWGGALVWRVALWHPELLKGVFGICTPYMAPSNGTYYPLEVLVEKGILNNFAYQLQFRGDEVESRVQDRQAIHQFLRTLFGGRTPEGAPAFDNKHGLHLDKFMTVGDSPLVSPAEMDYIVDEYARHGNMRGPLNWYRTRKENFDDEVTLADEGKTNIEVPALFVAASRDAALPPSMSVGMEERFTHPLQRAEVDTNHWALEEAPTQVNEAIEKFLNSLEEAKSKM